MDFAALMRQHHIARQDMLFGVVLGDDTGQQIALGRDHLAVFIGVLIEQRDVALFHQTTNFLVQPPAQLTRDVTIVAIFDVGTCQLLIRARHQLVFYRLLDFVDVDTRSIFHLLSDHAGDGSTVVSIDNFSGQSGPLDGLLDQHLVKRYLATVPFNHYWFHVVTPVPMGERRLIHRAKPQGARAAEGVDDIVDNYYI
ncbi:hypothetical protein D3C79_535170 [compost metagenome]